jgi:class 3 adenylate cyclase
MNSDDSDAATSTVTSPELRVAADALDDDASRFSRRPSRASGHRRSQAGRRVQRTFMFTDIVGSTTLLASVGDEAWSDLMDWHDEVLRRLFEQHLGREVKQVGDGFFTVFTDAFSALACGVAIQRSLSGHDRPYGFTSPVRVGVHRAHATQVGDDFIGTGVHEAARIGALADGGEVLTSVSTLAAAWNAFPAERHRAVTLRGFPEPIRVASLVCH